ncbi:MAG: hypothetical protein ACP5TY_04200, partial [Thermodesulforhabdaceae bacterium]
MTVSESSLQTVVRDPENTSQPGDTLFMENNKKLYEVSRSCYPEFAKAFCKLSKSFVVGQK